MIHKNSLESYIEGTKGMFKNRSQLIFEVYFFGSKELTDREVLRILKPGSDNLNYCQPRITEMVQDGAFEECGTKIEGGRKVRICRVKQPAEQRQQTQLF